MAVIAGCQTEVARTVRAVFGPFHTAESQAADQILLGGISDFCQKLLELLGMNLLPVAFDVVAEILDEALETLDFLRVRRLMHPVEKGDLLPVKILRHGLVRNEHEILDKLRGIVPVIGKNLRGMAIFVQMNLRLREIKVDRAAFSSVLPEKLCQYVHIFQHGDHIGVVFCKLRVLVRQDLFHLGVAHAMVRADHTLHDLMACHLAFFINIHKTAQGQPVQPFIERADPVGEGMGQHGNHPVCQINAGAPFQGLPVQSAVFLDIIGHIRDMDTQMPAVFVLCEGNGIIQVFRILAVYRHHKKIPKIGPSEGIRPGNRHIHAFRLV